MEEFFFKKALHFTLARAPQIRNQNKTRQAQLLMQIYSRIDAPDRSRALRARKSKKRVNA
jgi:hypothetical protein